MIEVKQEEVKKELKMNKAQKLLLGGAVLVSALIGFKAGGMYSTYLGDKGLKMCYEADPTLKEHIVNAICEVSKKQMME